MLRVPPFRLLWHVKVAILIIAVIVCLWIGRALECALYTCATAPVEAFARLDDRVAIAVHSVATVMMMLCVEVFIGIKRGGSRSNIRGGFQVGCILHMISIGLMMMMPVHIAAAHMSHVHGMSMRRTFIHSGKSIVFRVVIVIDTSIVFILFGHHRFWLCLRIHSMDPFHSTESRMIRISPGMAKSTPLSKGGGQLGIAFHWHLVRVPLVLQNGHVNTRNTAEWTRSLFWPCLIVNSQSRLKSAFQHIYQLFLIFLIP